MELGSIKMDPSEQILQEDRRGRVILTFYQRD
jgi:hypothetical protein